MHHFNRIYYKNEILIQKLILKNFTNVLYKHSKKIQSKKVHLLLIKIHGKKAYYNKNSVSMSQKYIQDMK